jgi:hypothetical protein
VDGDGDGLGAVAVGLADGLGDGLDAVDVFDAGVLFAVSVDDVHATEATTRTPADARTPNHPLISCGILSAVRSVRTICVEICNGA